MIFLYLITYFLCPCFNIFFRFTLVLKMIVVVVWETKSEEKISHPPCVEVLRRDSLISEGKKNKEGKEMVKMQVKTDLFSGYIHSSHGMLF